MSPTANESSQRSEIRPRTTQAATRRSSSARAARGAAVMLGVLGAAIGFAGPASATWSVVGTDPSTGQVGAAVASCVNTQELTTTMALIPKVGGAVSVGQAPGTTPTLLASTLRGGGSPEQVTTAMRSATVDSGYAVRQYGVAVLGSGAYASTGADTSRTSGARLSADGTATIQGNLLASPAVLDQAAAAFDATSGPLAARLLAALDAGGSAGGDRSCGAQARSAALVVVGAQSALFVPAATDAPTGAAALLDATDLTPAQIAEQAAQQSVRPAPRGARAPIVYLSAVTGADRDAVAVIGERYATLVAAEAKTSPADTDAVIDPAYQQGLTVAALILFCVIGLIIAALIISGLRRADRRASAERSDDSPTTPAPYRGEVARLFDVDLTAARRRKRIAEQEAAGSGRQRDSVWSGTSW